MFMIILIIHLSKSLSALKDFTNNDKQKRTIIQIEVIIADEHVCEFL